MVLVTGGSGMVGTHLIEALLKEGRKVKALYHNNAPSIIHENLLWEHTDILDIGALEESMQGISQVYHCAAIVSFNPNAKKQLFQINVEGTANVVNACINMGVKKLLFVSSVAALGRFRENEIVTEAMQWSEATGSSVYGRTKYLAEMEVWRGIGEGLNAVIINPTIILGVGNWERGSSGIFKTVYDEFPWFTDGISGFVDVADVIKAMLLLMDNNVAGERFIINGANLPYKDVFTKIANRFSKKPPHLKVSKWMAAIVWRIEAVKAFITGKLPLLTKETAHTAMSKVEFSNNKLLTQFPNFTFTPIDESITRICNELIARYKL